MSTLLQYEFLILLLLAIVILELVARKLRLPPAAALILGGAALALVPGVPAFTIDPELVLVIFLPPLLMNSAYFTVWKDFRDNVRGILLLAIGAVVFTTAAVGLVLHALVPGLPWAVCFAIGAIVSPPDAIAADAILEDLPLPGRITAVLQGESLINDASGLVLFKFAVAAALTGAFSAYSALASFGILAIGQAGLFVLRRVRDSELAITATLLLPVFSYVGGDQIGVSGVLATVTTGLLMGWHQHSILSAGTRMRAQAFWKVLVFLLQSILFILIGLSLRGVLARVGQMQHAGRDIWTPVAGVVLAVILSRFVWLFGTDLLARTARRLGLPAVDASVPVATVMSWAGMRGVVTLAAALSLPLALPGRDLALVCAFAVILVTVIVQGTTLAPLISALRLIGPDELAHREASEDVAWHRMSVAQYEAIARLSRQPDGSERHPRLVEQYALRARLAGEASGDKDAHRPIKIEHNAAVLEAISAARAEVLKMHGTGEIHDRVLRSIEQELDLQQLVAESHL